MPLDDDKSEDDRDPLAWIIELRGAERAVDGAGKTGLAVALLGMLAAAVGHLSRRPRSVVPALPRGVATMLWDGGLLALGGGLLVAVLAGVVSGALMLQVRRGMTLLGDERPEPRVGEAFGPLRVLYEDAESLVMARTSPLAFVGLWRLLLALGAVALAGGIAYAATHSRTLIGTVFTVVKSVALLAFAAAMVTPASTEFRVEPTRAGPVLRLRRTRWFFWHHPVEAPARDVRLELDAEHNALRAVCGVALVGDRVVEERVELCRLGAGRYATFQRERLVRALCERLGVPEPEPAPEQHKDEDEEGDEDGEGDEGAETDAPGSTSRGGNETRRP